MKKLLLRPFLLAATAIAISCSNNGGSDLIAYSDGSDWGFINRKGEIVINPQFKNAYNFSEGLALVKNAEGLYGFIDDAGTFQGGDPSFSEATYYSEGKAWTVKPLGSPTCIDESGAILFSCESCEFVSNYADGLALFAQKNKDGDLQYGYLDKNGKVEITAQFDYARDFNNGFAAVRNKKGKWGFINTKGEIKINYQFEEVSPQGFADNDMVAVSDGKKWGWVNADGKYVCNPQFKGVWYIADDFWLVSDGDKIGFTSNDGKYLVNPQFKRSEFTYPHHDHDLLPYGDGSDWGYIDQEGKIVINPQFEYAYPFVNGLAIVKSANGYGIINKEGKYEVNPQFNSLRNDDDDSKGSNTIRTQYVDISSLSKDLATVKGILDGSLSIGAILEAYEASADNFASSYYPQYRDVFYGRKSLSEAGLYLDNLEIWNGDLRTTKQTKVSNGWYSYTTEKQVLLKDKKPSLWKFSIYGSGKLYGHIRHLFDAALLAEFKGQLSGYEFAESVDPDDEETVTYTFTNATNTITIEVHSNKAYFSLVKNEELAESEGVEAVAEEVEYAEAE